MVWDSWNSSLVEKGYVVPRWVPISRLWIGDANLGTLKHINFDDAGNRPLLPIEEKLRARTRSSDIG